MNKNKTAFSNFESEKKNYVKTGNKKLGPFMEEYGEDVISEVVQNEIRVKPKTKKVNIENKNNSSNN